MSPSVSQLAEFLLELDALKAVDRRTYINQGARLENSAEHSWHLAMACWAFAEHLPQEYDLLKLLQLALVHDLGEVDAGDTFLYSDDRSAAHIQERACVARMAAHPGNPIPDLPALWEEQESGQSQETRLLKVIDRLLPFLLNIANQGRTWREHGVHKDQVLKMHRFIEGENPEIYRWFLSKLEYAVEQGWLRDD